jgi:hypothetical protein
LEQSKGYDAVMKKAVKEQSIGMSYVLKRKVTEKVFKAEKFLVTTVQKVDLQILCTALFQMFEF